MVCACYLDFAFSVYITRATSVHVIHLVRFGVASERAVGVVSQSNRMHRTEHQEKKYETDG